MLLAPVAAATANFGFTLHKAIAADPRFEQGGGAEFRRFTLGAP